MNEIIAQLFAARDIAHAIHLRTRSFAQHMALGDFYEEIVDLADAVAETYSGKYGTLTIQPCQNPAVFAQTDAVAFIRSVADWAEKVHSQLNPADSYIINQWEEILALVYRAKYKLENLA